MNTKEKAREIALEYEDLCVIDLEDVAMEAMQWKEQQMIEKACEWLNNNTVTSANGSVIYTASSYNIDKKTFIEQFKKAMEE